MPEWHKASERKPESGQSCVLIPRGSRFGELSVHGPISWHEGSDMWIDLFATPEAGEIITIQQVAYWCDAREVLPDDLAEIPWEDAKEAE